MAVDRDTFGFESTTDEVLDGISLEGKRAVITGTSGGLGAETARALAARGAAITLAARDLEKLETVAASICCPGLNCSVNSRGASFRISLG